MAEKYQMTDEEREKRKAFFKNKISENQEKQFTQEIEPPYFSPPFSDDGKKQGKWVIDYKFNEWYITLKGDLVIIIQSFNEDTIGCLYDENQYLFIDLPLDSHGNFIPIILQKLNGDYFEFQPIFELILPRIKEMSKKSKKFQKKHLQSVTLSNTKRYELENFKQGENMVKVDCERGLVNIVFIGHIDAGKSTLSGRILKNCGEVDEGEIRKYQQKGKENNRESWALAYVMDIHEEERLKGITIECGTSNFQLRNRRFLLLDAPGLKIFVPNMIAGACQADYAALIISARNGEFEAGMSRGQTQENAYLAKALGVQHIICVVTKMDQVNWDKKRYDQIQDAIDPFLKETVKILSVQWIPINSFHNENIDTPLNPNRCDWYSGGTLFDMLNKIPIPVRNSDAPIRIPVLDKISQSQCFYGKIEQGTIREDIWVTLMPQKKQFQIGTIYNSRDQRILYASAGENVKIIPKAFNELDIERGNVACSTEELCPVTQLFIAELTLLKLPKHKSIISEGYKCVLHIHTSVQDIEIMGVEAVMDPQDQKFMKSTFLKVGQTGVVKIGMKNPLCVEKFETVQQLGRLIIRDENETIGFGKVIKICPVKI